MKKNIYKRNSPKQSQNFNTAIQTNRFRKKIILTSNLIMKFLAGVESQFLF
jgi:hypothetical protein